MKKTVLFLLVSMSICSISLAQPTFAPRQNIDGPPGGLISLDAGTLIGGTGYSDASDVAVTGGSGSGGTVDIITAGGVVTSVTVNRPGVAYTASQSLTISGGGGNAMIDVLTIDETFVGTDPTLVVSGDLDGDTDIDIAVGTYYFAAGTTQDYIKWYQNDGSGNFTSQTSVSESVLWVQGLLIVDVDGLNGNDIVATVGVGNKLVYYPNDGVGGFGSEVVISNTINGIGPVVAGDIDKDGILDLVTASYTDNETIWFKGDGIGGFVEQTLSPIQSGGTGGPWYIDIADFDNDTDLDVLVGFFNNGNIEIYYNQYVESGVAMTVSWLKDVVTVDSGVSFLGVPTKQIGFADVNNDGDLDVISSNNSTGNVRWYSKIKDGASTINPISDNSIIARPATVVVADLDNDNLNDVILTDGGSINNSIIWFKGASNSGPTLVTQEIVDNNFQYWSIVVDDFDNDTDNDIAAVGVFSDTLDWYENYLINPPLEISDNKLNKIKIYPNPTAERLNFKSATFENFKVSVYDILGKEIIKASVGSNKPLDVSKLQSGLYIIKFDDYNTTYKFIKE